MRESEHSSDRSITDLIRDLNRSTDHLRHAYADSRGVYHTDFRAMLLIHCAPRHTGSALTAGELATALELSSGAVTYLVERLAQAGYVQRQVDPLDRRKVLLAPTAAGTKLVRDYLNPLDRMLHDAAAELGQERVAQAMEVMTRISGEMLHLTDKIRVADGKAPWTSQF